jgi:elongation factor G
VKHKILIELPSIQFAQTVLSMAIEPENTTERKKLAEVLEMLQRQDPTFKAAENSESGQTLISGMGELHLEVIKHRLTRDFQFEREVLQAARQLSRDDWQGG